MFDRQRTIVTKPDPKTGAVLEWNRAFAEVLARMGPAVELCWPYRANQNGYIESFNARLRDEFTNEEIFCTPKEA